MQIKRNKYYTLIEHNASINEVIEEMNNLL